MAQTTANLSRLFNFTWNPKQDVGPQMATLIRALNQLTGTLGLAVSERHGLGDSSTRPSPGIKGRFFFATDTSILYVDNGNVWQSIGGPGGTVTSVSGTPNQILASNPTGGVVLTLDGPHNYTTQTNHALLVGRGTAAVTTLAAASDGQIPIGQTGADPNLSVPAGTANRIAVNVGPGSLTFDLSGPHAFSSQTSHAVLVGQGTSPISGILLGNNQVLVGQAGADPTGKLGVVMFDRSVGNPVVDLVNSAAETTFYSNTVPGGFLGLNGMLRIHFLADYLNNSAGTDSLTIRLYWGGSVVLTSTISSIAQSANRRVLRGFFDLSATNSQASQVAGGNVILGDALTAGTMGTPLADVYGTSGPLSVNSSVNQTLSLTAQLGTASANIEARFYAVQIFAMLPG